MKKDITIVQPFHKDMSSSIQDGILRKDEEINHAKFLNNIARVVFAIILAVFNVVIWAIAFLELSRPAEYYLKGH